MEVPRPLGAACGIVAPVVFVGGWAVLGTRAAGYEPLEDAISLLAREGAPTRPAMTLCFAVFGLLLPIWAWTLAARLGVPALRPVVTTAGLATLAVAALPLSREGGQGQDAAHAVAALTGYLAMVLTPLVAARGLRGPSRTASLLVAAVAAVALTGSVATGSGGLQRLGLTVVDAWHVALAGTVLRAARP